MTCKNFNE